MRFQVGAVIGYLGNGAVEAAALQAQCRFKVAYLAMRTVRGDLDVAQGMTAVGDRLFSMAEPFRFTCGVGYGRYVNSSNCPTGRL